MHILKVALAAVGVVVLILGVLASGLLWACTHDPEQGGK